MAADEVYAGGCLCGAVRYRVEGPLRAILICHCRQCRRSHGHVAAYTASAPAHLRLVESGGLRWYRSSEAARRGFCAQCGASLFWEPAHGRHVSISAGSLDDPRGLTCAAHIYVAGRPDYDVIADGLPQHAEGTPAVTDAPE